MKFAEQLTALNAQRTVALTGARQFPFIHPQGASGIRRDRAQAKALRNYRSGLALVGVRPR